MSNTQTTGIGKDLPALQAEPPCLSKDARSPLFHSSYATPTSVLETVEPLPAGPPGPADDGRF